jgi:integrase
MSKKTPEIYLPDEVQALFIEALNSRPKLIPFLSMAFWGGIRPEEIKRISWSDVNFKDKEVHIKPEDSKTHSGRYVHISQNFEAWLNATPIEDGLIFPYSNSSLTRWRKEIHKAIGVKTINDGARHTFATFHYILHGLDDTMQELGHTDSKMLFNHYRGLAKNRKQQAVKFFDIYPPSNEQEGSAATQE